MLVKHSKDIELQYEQEGRKLPRHKEARNFKYCRRCDTNGRSQECMPAENC